MNGKAIFRDSETFKMVKCSGSIEYITIINNNIKGVINKRYSNGIVKLEFLIMEY